MYFVDRSLGEHLQSLEPKLARALEEIVSLILFADLITDEFLSWKTEINTNV